MQVDEKAELSQGVDHMIRTEPSLEQQGYVIYRLKCPCGYCYTVASKNGVNEYEICPICGTTDRFEEFLVKELTT